MKTKKMKSAGIYDSFDYSLVGVFNTKTAFENAKKNTLGNVVAKTFYEVYPSQLEVLSYTEATQIELILTSAREWRTK